MNKGPMYVGELSVTTGALQNDVAIYAHSDER